MNTRGLAHRTDGDGRRASPVQEAIRYPLAYFAVAGLVSLTIVGGAGAFASRRVGADMAVNEVRHLGETISRSIAEPALTETLLAGDIDALQQFDELVRNRVLTDDLVRVKLWDIGGKVIYSDEPRLVGQTFALADHEKAAFENGATLATTTGLDEPSNRYEAEFGRLLEVYSPVQGPSGEPLLFEVYYRFEAVNAHSSQMWRAFLPIILGTVLVLGLLQLPLAWRVTRHLTRNREHRELLLHHAIDAANVEDRRIASDLHDGVLQDLAASSFTLVAADLLIERGDPTRARELVAEAAEDVSASMLALRALVVDLYPPNLREEGLELAIADLVKSSSSEGLKISLETAALPAMSPEAELLAYRTVRESLRNVIKHAEAQNVVVTLSDGSDTVVIDITDDGKGFPTDDPAADGHVGLRLLSDLSAEIDAKLRVESTPGGGTKVRLEVAP